jgi:prepilin-type N-terminal cleavage/methylation domain-containing protein
MSSFPHYRGFTLIEILVVIAIIGVLSSILLSSLNTARAKSADAAAQSDLNNVRAQSELFYDANGSSYVAPNNLCAQGAVANGVKGIYDSLQAAANAEGLSIVNTDSATAGTLLSVTCHVKASGNLFPYAWAAEVPLKSRSGFMYCVDNTGLATTTSKNLPVFIYNCQ